jgi:predicted  nucleic acid-binding Zn-ribbon protein
MQEVSNQNDEAIQIANYQLSNYSKELEEVSKGIKSLEQQRETAEVRLEQLKGAVYAIQVLLTELNKPATKPEPGV